MDDSTVGVVQVFVGEWSAEYEALSIRATKQTSSTEIVDCIIERLNLPDGNIPNGYELAEVIGNSVGQECKERRLAPTECPVALMLLWPKKNSSQQEYYKFYLRKRQPTDNLWSDSRFPMDPQLLKDYFNRFLHQPKDKEYPDLCQLPDLNERTLLDNLRARFEAGNIYTYVGSILIAVNPFKFYPIYNPKYVKLYQNRRLGTDAPPHIFAIADAAYHSMLKEKRNQCIVISGESGSGKTESTNFLLHHLTALSQKGSHGSGVEQTILSAGPVLEAFGNAKTAHNNNSSRFGKFIQVNYKENGMVHGAVVQKYLLEKSRIVSQGKNERNYHVFYYLLTGANEQEKQVLHLRNSDWYHYLNKSGCYGLENADERHEFSRLKQSMEMVGFTPEKQRRLFAVLSAVLLLGNVEFLPKKSYNHHEEVMVKNPEVVALISELLRVKQETLILSLTAKRVRASGETLVINYRLPEAVAARDAMAKCLYGALFDWIVLQVNHALLSKKETTKDHQGNSIGVLDIFGFEDFKVCNSFEQLCINYANEQLQHYFNQHVFKYEQSEYKKQGIRWTDIDYSDNSGCLNLIEGKPNGLLCLLDDQCNFPGASNETLLQKFNSVHEKNRFYEAPQRRDNTFIVRHYAGAVRYQVANMREKNLDLMRPDGVVGVLKNSSLAFVRELVGADPVAVFRWAILRAFFRAHFAFQAAGRAYRHGRADGNKSSVQNRYRTPNENVLSSHSSRHSRAGYSKQRTSGSASGVASDSVNNNHHHRHNHYHHHHHQHHNNNGSSSVSNNNRLSWPQIRNVNQLLVAGSNANNRAENQQQTQQQQVFRGRIGSAKPLPREEANVMERANQIVMKNKSFRPRERGKKGLKNLQTVKTLAGRTQSYGTGPGKARKQPMTVSAQFQQSLHSLMDTLNQANPFFIRCIKSNGQKEPNEFDEETVQRQLRYTGMLETVRIRQAGFNVRLTYDEFIQLYRMLLPKGLSSTKIDIRDSLLTFNLNRDHYELGDTKIFLRESEKIKLDIELHQQIITSITTIQNWFRACLERRRFLRLRKAVITVQSAVRMWKAKKDYKIILKQKSKAVIQIQSLWRAYRQRKYYKKLREWTIRFQALTRGYLVRKTLPELRKKKKAGVSTVVVNPVISNKEQRDLKTTHDPNLDSLLESERLAQSFDYRNRIAALSSNFEPNFETSLPLKPRKLVPVKQSSTTKTFLNNEVNSPTNVSEHRKSSLESIASLQSYESQVSVESLESHQRVSTPPHQQQIQQPQQAQPVPNTRVRRVGTVDSQHTLSTGSSRPSSSSRRTDSSSTGCSDGENDAETPSAVRSAPPVFPSVSSFPSPREFKYQQDVWHKKSEHDYYVPPVVPKPTITRSPNVSQHLHKNMSESLQEQERLNRIERLNMNMKIGKIDNPMRRRMSEDEIKEYSNYLRKQNSEEIVSTMQTSVTVGLPKEKSEPNVPVRNARRNRPPRDLQCRSMGESVIEVPTEPRNSILNTIKESDLVKDVNVWVQKEESPPNSEWSNKKDSHFKYMPQGTKRIRSGQTPPKMELRRRNSDPTTKTLLGSQIKSSDSPTNDLKPPHNSTLLEWKGSGTQFSLAGHNFRKIARFSKDDVCVCCNEQMDAFVTQGYKCTDCKKPFHVKCIQNGGVVKISCVSGNTPNRRNKRKSPRTPYEQNKQGVSSKFSLTGTSAYSDSTNQIIASEKELGLMEEFIMKKIEIMEVQDDGKKPPSEVDRVFKKALRKFKDELVMTYSVVIQQGNVEGNIKYTDLIANFVQVIENVCKQENLKEDFPVTMGVNAFRGFMNEFMVQAKTESSEKSSKSKRKREKKDKSKKDDPIPHGKHMFQLTIINIPTACELCSSFFMWPIERGLVCQNCRLTSHKKCYRRASKECSKDCPSSVKMELNSHKVFGVPLSKLDCGDGRIPLVVDRLITTIELHGLYTEGIYRKSGVSSKVKELKNAMDDEGHENIDFKNYQVHVLAAVLKSFLRDMPEPLLTFEYYDDFLHAASLTEPADRVSTLYGILKKLPRPNYDLMERLILHLARVAFHELDNRMSPSALAIVFAPCILRTHRTLPAQDSLQDVGRQTRCVETIVEEKLRALTTTLADINDLDKACTTANKRLSSLRSSKNMSPEELSTTLSNVVSRSAAGPDEEVAALVGHIKTIQQEKALLTSTLPSLTRASSDDDLISANDLDDPSIDDSLVLPSADGLLRKKPIQRQDSAESNFPSIINVDEDMVMV
ncbi:hypothetical protein TKK_0002041 [Trichogramma kaykai]